MSVNALANNVRTIAQYVLIAALMIISTYSSAQSTEEAKAEAEADLLLEQQDYAGAEKKYTQILTKSKGVSTNPQLFYKRAYAYFGLEQFNNALKDLNLYLEKNPSDLQAKLLRANVYLGQGDADNALNDIDALILVNPNPELLRWRVSVAMEAGKFKIAQQDILTLLNQEQSPELEAYLGLTYYYQDKQDSAMFIFNSVIKKYPEYVQSYLYAGSLCLEAGEYDLALEYINKGLRLEPGNETLLFYKGATLVEKPERVNEGCRCLMKAFTAGFDDAADYLKEYCYGVE
ncbi:MAG TPA: tetratricopeptide repeat protein [Ohtaekwangia sp.]